MTLLFKKSIKCSYMPQLFSGIMNSVTFKQKTGIPVPKRINSGSLRCAFTTFTSDTEKHTNLAQNECMEKRTHVQNRILK